MRQRYDVIIAGAGAAGWMAALELSRAGRSVLILEKGKSPVVSNFARAGGPAAAETAIQRKERAWLENDTLFRHMSGWARHTVNDALLRNVIACTGTAVDALEALGFALELIPDTYGVGFRARHIIHTKGKDRVALLQKEVEACGGRLLCDTKIRQAVLEDGAVRGVKALTAQGQELEFSTEALLVCTGGFQGSRELIRRFFGLNHMASLGNNLSSGDGILLCEGAGAVTDRNFALPGNEGSATTTKCREYNDNLCFGICGGLLTDHNGLRFINEKEIADFPLALGGEAFARHEKTYAVLDDEMYRACAAEGIYHYLGEPENWGAGRALWHPVLDRAEKQFPKAVEEGWAVRTDTIEAAAEYFHLPKLPDTVLCYNAMCEAGIDSEFGKSANFMRPIRKAPFYVFEYEPACWCTIGGIKTDSRLQALDADGHVIPGLYVAGVDNGSMYCAPYYDNEGSALGLALGSGVFAARVIAEKFARNAQSLTGVISFFDVRSAVSCQLRIPVIR